jgi:hypothetical protein
MELKMSGNRAEHLSIDKASSNHNSHPSVQQTNFNAGFAILMLVDGVGLAIIAACTILEGYDLW